MSPKLSDNYTRRMAQPEIPVAAAGPVGRSLSQLLCVCKPLCRTPRGPRKGKAAKRRLGWEAHRGGAAENVRSGERATGAEAGAQGSSVAAASCSVGWMLWGY